MGVQVERRCEKHPLVAIEVKYLPNHTALSSTCCDLHRAYVLPSTRVEPHFSAELLSHAARRWTGPRTSSRTMPSRSTAARRYNRHSAPRAALPPRIQKSEFRNPQFLLHSLTFLWSVLESTASLNQGTQCPWPQAERGADIGRGDLVPTSATRFKRRMVRHVVAG